MARPQIHGMSTSRLYMIWRDMRRRCHDEKTRAFREYGARGISVCDEWRDKFEPFRDWALSNGYDDNLTIDRFPDKNGNYEPSNCRWATRMAQALNRNNTRLISYRGETVALTELARRFGLRPDTLSLRLSKDWDLHQALTTKPRKQGTRR